MSALPVPSRQPDQPSVTIGAARRPHAARWQLCLWSAEPSTTHPAGAVGAQGQADGVQCHESSAPVLKDGRGRCHRAQSCEPCTCTSTAFALQSLLSAPLPRGLLPCTPFAVPLHFNEGLLKDLKTGLAFHSQDVTNPY